MKQKKFPEDTIDATIEFLKDKKFLNDSVFSRSWIENAIKRSIGLRRIKRELLQKGVPLAVVEESLAQAQQGYSEDRTVQDLISRKIEAMKGQDARKVKQKSTPSLSAVGFLWTLPRTISIRHLKMKADILRDKYLKFLNPGAQGG